MSSQELYEPLPGCSLQDILDSLPLAIYVKDKTQNYTWCNTQFTKFCDCNKHSITGKGAKSFFQGDLADLAQKYDLAVMKDKSIHVFNAQLTCCEKDLNMRVIKIPAYDTKKDVVGVISVAFDRAQDAQVETELMRALSALQEDNLALQERAIELQSSLAFTEDNAAQIVEIAEATALEADTFKSRAEDLESSLAFTESHAAQLAQLAEELDEQRRDIEDQNKKIMQMMYKDHNTDVHNRRYFFDKSPEFLNRGYNPETPGVLAVLDIDFLESINSKYGHQVGDDALWIFASIIKDSLPDDAMFCRIGGEEFAIITPALSIQDSLHLLETVRKAVESHDIDSKDNIFNLTFSTGVVPLDPTRKIADILYDADIAMYQAKAAGRNCIMLNGPKAA